MHDDKPVWVNVGETFQTTAEDGKNNTQKLEKTGTTSTTGSYDRMVKRNSGIQRRIAGL